ncbi:MAG: hypothetical protein AABX60_03695, partial [Nanoarchaeota archaeon]
IVICFDDISDAYRHLTKHFAKSKLSPPVIKAYHDLNQLMRKAYEWFYSPTDKKLAQELFNFRDISYKSIYSAETQKTKLPQDSGVLEAIQAMRAAATQIVRERMAMGSTF